MFPLRAHAAPAGTNPTRAGTLLLPGGRYLILMLDTVLQCRRVSDGALMCDWPTALNQIGPSPRFSAEILDGGEEVNMVVCSNRYLEIIGLDLTSTDNIPDLHLQLHLGGMEVYRTKISGHHAVVKMQRFIDSARFFLVIDWSSKTYCMLGYPGSLSSSLTIVPPYIVSAVSNSPAKSNKSKKDTQRVEVRAISSLENYWVPLPTGPGNNIVTTDHKITKLAHIAVLAAEDIVTSPYRTETSLHLNVRVFPSPVSQDAFRIWIALSEPRSLDTVCLAETSSVRVSLEYVLVTAEYVVATSGKGTTRTDEQE
ncbi:hypothetical protein C8F01DRAFT_1286466 [Mycena amicta]|nr:hypothetical protein C8F01DRAFT_1286466 [Mycena amicta]